jgi:hypothetical protein
VPAGHRGSDRARLRRETPEAVVQAMAHPEVRTAVGATGSIMVETMPLDVAQRFDQEQVRMLDAMTKDINFRA